MLDLVKTFVSFGRLQNLKRILCINYLQQ